MDQITELWTLSWGDQTRTSKKKLDKSKNKR